MEFKRLRGLKKPLTKEEICDVLVDWELIWEESILDRNPLPPTWPEEDGIRDVWEEVIGNHHDWDFDCPADADEWYDEDYASKKVCPNCDLEVLTKVIFRSKYDIVSSMIGELKEIEEIENRVEDGYPPSKNEKVLEFLQNLKERGYIAYDE